MSTAGRVAYYTLGCKLNFSETSAIARNLQESGYARVEFEENPDVFVINTCSVTDNADKKCRALVRKAKSINPNSTVVVIGCYAQLKPKEISQMEGVDMVLGANEKFNVAKYLEDKNSLQDTTLVKEGSIKEVQDFKPAFSAGDRTRSFLKVQDGCDYFCTFCTIPLARGKSRNATIAETVQQAEEVAARGFKEVVLTGVNIGDFGQGGDEDFLGLIKALDIVGGIERFRISSIEPNLVHEGVIDFVANSKKFMPHFHIPLQSGNDDILKAMRRKYDTALFKERILMIKERIPDVCIGVDVIVGFPGETEEHFMDSFNLLHDLEVSYLHVFTYSERDNTTAKKMKDAVPMAERKERSKRLRILSNKLKRAFYAKYEGATRPVLFEGEDVDGMIQGYSDNYLRVQLPYDESLAGKIVHVTTGSINSDCVYSCDIVEPVEA